MGTLRAAIYARISDDRIGAGLGVTRQEDDCRALCEKRGWDVGEVYVDNDVSAYSGKKRPAYRRLLDDIRAGQVDALVCWDADRLHRSPTELEAFIALVETTGVEIATVNAGNYDLTTAAGRMTARVVGAVARHESEHKAERVRRKIGELAADGKWSGGPRPFGYVTGAGPLEEFEAQLIRDACTAVLAGASLYSIELAWAGVTTPRGAKWRAGTVRWVLLSARIAGLREHRGEIVGAAAWPAIVDRDTWEHVRAVLTDPARGANPDTTRRYFLSGLVWCSLCGGRLRASGQGKYRCAECRKVGILREPLEQMIVAQLCIRLSGGLPAAPQGPDAGLGERIAAIEEQVAEWDKDRDDGVVSRARWLTATQRLQGQADDLRRQYRAERRRVDLPPITVEAWEGFPLAQRRVIVGEMIERVTVRPAVRGLGRFDTDRVDVRWLR